ncbi:MAG: redoxin domain-containing protein [Proteobacteria bacterium]|nr:redoxin domain-containing protein [Pseudomonadota bacterium]
MGQKGKNSTHELVLVLALLWIFISFGCGDSGSENEDTSEDDTTDSDVDSDSDTGSDTVIDTDNTDLCEDYPKSDDNFAQGSVITNYSLINEEDEIFELCELAEGNELLLMKITRDVCPICQEEATQLVTLSAEYKDRGVVVFEAQQAVMSQAELTNWVDGREYDSFRTKPSKQIVEDYRKTELIPIKGVYLLVDLLTMKVLNPYCGEKHDKGIECIEAHL